MESDEAQRRVLARLGPWVGDVDSVHVQGVMQQLNPLRRQMFADLVRIEMESTNKRSARNARIALPVW